MSATDWDQRGPGPAGGSSASHHYPLQHLKVYMRGLCDYATSLAQMQSFCATRTTSTSDELWLLEHPSVFTLGISGGAHHLHDAGDVPVAQTDRGGQITWHGPGQLVAYVLLDLRRNGLAMGALIKLLEQAVINAVARWGIVAVSRRDAPGVYVGKHKLASIGMRLKRGSTYHGIALNVGNDLSPFGRINPCGHAGLQMTRLADIGGPTDVGTVAPVLAHAIQLALAAAARCSRLPTPTGAEAFQPGDSTPAVITACTSGHEPLAPPPAYLASHAGLSSRLLASTEPC